MTAYCGSAISELLAALAGAPDAVSWVARELCATPAF
jgi:hypothetical protein